MSKFDESNLQKYEEFKFLSLRGKDISIEEVDKALEADPENIELLKKKAMYHINMETLDDNDEPYYFRVVYDAIKIIDKALEADPKNVSLLIDKVAFYYIEEYFSEAVGEIDEALKIEPENDRLLKIKVEIIKREYIDSTIESYILEHEIDEALEIEPNNAGLLRTKANQLARLNDYDQALTVVNKALEIEPENPEILKDKAHYLARLNDYEQALTVVNKALEIEPENPEIIEDKLDYLNYLEQYDEIDNLVYKYLDYSTDFRINKVNNLISWNKCSEAIEFVNKEIEDNTFIDFADFDSPWKNKIRIYKEMNDRDSVKKTIDEAYLSYYNKAMELFAASDFEGAYEHFMNAKKVKPKEIDAWIKAGDSKYKLGHYGLANQKYQKVIDLDNMNVEAWQKKALALKKQGKDEEAEKCLSRARELDPDFKPNFDHKMIPAKTIRIEDNNQFLLLDELLENKKQVIVYGPPGTGKTYLGQRFVNAKSELSNSKFITFHQSYAYEEFIEGLRPQIDDSGNICYHVNEGMFKNVCRNALNDLLDLCETEKRWEDGENIPELSTEEIESVKQALLEDSIPKYYLLIDEINRGDISRIFGELITSLETDKRMFEDNEIIATLPYSNKTFAIPPNLYIIGTMNTADKSIALVDIALRRRFSFVEMMPDYTVLQTQLKSESKDVQEIFGVAINSLMNINESIEKNYDRDHVIGHSYLLKLKGSTSSDDALKRLKNIFYYDVVPLLQEYYYDSPAKLQEVLGNQFVEVKSRSFKINDNLNGEVLLKALSSIKGPED